jgi:hypothetical protein
MRIAIVIVLAGTVGCVRHVRAPQPETAVVTPAPTAKVVKDVANARFITKTPPPAAYVESPPPNANATAVWIPGYFKWDGHDFDWVPGRWTIPPAGVHEWVPGEWTERSDGRWQFADGHWQ